MLVLASPKKALPLSICGGLTSTCPSSMVHVIHLPERLRGGELDSRPRLRESKKEKELFRTQRKAVEAGAHGTLEYTIKKGVNKNKIADDKIIKSKK